MYTLSQLQEQSMKGQPLWLPELRQSFAAAESARPLILRLRCLFGPDRDEHLAVPVSQNAAERALVLSVLKAEVYNLLSVWSGKSVCFFFSPDDPELARLISELESDLHSPGYDKPLRIAARLCRHLQQPPFFFETAPLSEYLPAPVPEKPESASLAAHLQEQCRRAEHLALCGIDVGGTDIKLAASLEGRLICVKEYDWNPAAYTEVDQLLSPLLLLTRLMAACLAAERFDAGDALRTSLSAALQKNAAEEEIAAAVAEAERVYGSKLSLLDGIGVSFPDVVIHDRILGGETPKTKGMRENPLLDYEQEFAKLSGLKDRLAELCRPDAAVHITNDGNMAAFTAAMELAHGDDPASIAQGIVAHSLGTDLGTGWLQADGCIPPIPLELYDLLLDLGSTSESAYPPADLRSTRNENSGLPGLRRYLGQAAAFRLAWELNPHLLQGFAQQQDTVLCIPTSPVDLRKPCLEHLMGQADMGQEEAEEVFRRVGEHLALAVLEMDHLLSPAPRDRFLFGRFVKSPRCFRLLCEGFARRAPLHRLIAADEGMAFSPLMRQLAARTDVTVAQFGQAVGALTFALT